jgi:TatD DNase family protein
MPASIRPRRRLSAGARAAGVKAQVLAAVSARSWPKLKAVAARYPGLYPSYGLHPAYLAEHRPEHLGMLADWLIRERPVPIGECGLDYYLPDLDPDVQADYFTGQLRLARRHDLPVIIHARHAVDQVIKRVRRFPGVRGVVHSFSGSVDQARRLLDLGILLGFGGPPTYPRATRLRGLIRYLPLDGFMLETDAPDQPPSGHRGARNEPAFWRKCWLASPNCAESIPLKSLPPPPPTPAAFQASRCRTRRPALKF